MIGSVDADVIVASYPYVVPFLDACPGLTGTHSVLWGKEPSAASSSDFTGLIAALTDAGRLRRPRRARRSRTPARSVRVPAGTHASRTRQCSSTARTSRSAAPVFLPTSWGDVLMVVALGDTGSRRPKRWSRMASSARRATDAEWESIVVDATGGPGLNPDPGAVGTRARALGPISTGCSRPDVRVMSTGWCSPGTGCPRPRSVPQAVESASPRVRVRR